MRNKEGRFYYLCNQAVKPKAYKSTINWNEVTCKNCLKQKIKKKDYLSKMFSWRK